MATPRWKRPLLIALIGLLSLAALSSWLLYSNSGLRAAVALISGPQLQISDASGQLAGPLHLGALRWQSPDGSRVEAAEIDLDWSPARLWAGELAIHTLTLGRLSFQSGQGAPTPPPTALTLPFTVDLPKLAISSLYYGEQEIARALSAQIRSDGERHELLALHAESGLLQLNASATLDGRGELPLQADARLSGEFEGQHLQLKLLAQGPLARLPIQAKGEAGISGEASATLTPFAARPFSALHLALDQLNPAQWQSHWPPAQLSLRADIEPKGDALVGNFQISNTRPQPHDRQGLPLAQLGGQLHWQGQQLSVTALRAEQGGGGSLHGQAHWQDETLQLDLQATQLDLARIDSRLRSTRLNGPLHLQLARSQQAFRFALSEQGPALQSLQLRGDGSLSDEQLHLAQLELTQGEARLQAEADIALKGNGAFSAHGSLRRLQPQSLLRNAALPEMLLNGEFKLHGQRQPQLAVAGDFRLADSRIKQQPLSGEGAWQWQGERLLNSQLKLAAGPNQLTAQGSFGRPGDRLEIALNAPQLDLIGLDGGLSSRLTLTGSAQAAQLQAEGEAARFGLPGLVKLSGLNFKLNASNAPSAAQALDLRLAQLATPAAPKLLEKLTLTLQGPRENHQIQGQATLLGDNALQLALQGSLDPNGRWQGEIRRLQLQSQEKARNFHLPAPAPLQIARDAWQVGPLGLAGDTLDWQAQLTARANEGKLSASLKASGSRIGQIDGELNAGLASPWRIDANAPWRGRLSNRSPDLAWLGAAIGEDWQSAGSLESQLELSGTPNAPISNGYLRGDKLALRLPNQGLALVDGRLNAELRDNRLRLNEFRFSSLHQPMPRALRLASEREVGSLAALTASPGRLEIGGEMRVDRNFAESAQLELTLDRLGAWQLPDQWLLVSGKAQLSWQAGVLGLQGKLKADAGYWQLAPGGQPRLSDDVTIQRPGSERTTPALRPRLKLDLLTDLGPAFLFSGAGLSSRLAGEVRLSAQERDLPRASGSIQTRDGRFEAYGQKLDIERGAFHFNGLLDNPALDVRAVRKGLSVEPGVQLGGTARKPVLRLISSPELPDPEKLAWLVLGHGPESMGAGDAPLLIAAAGGLLGNDSGNLLGQLRKTFGIDELGVRQGQLGDSGSRPLTSRVATNSQDTASSTGNQIFSIGKRLSSNAVLSYEQALGKAESIVKLTVTLNRNLSLVGRAGSDNALDLFYTVLFGRAESSTARKAGP